MLRSLTARQFAEWMAFAELEPFGELRDDYRAASIREMVYNINVSKKDRKPLEDFLLNFGDSEKPSKKKQTWQDQKAMFLMMVSSDKVARMGDEE